MHLLSWNRLYLSISSCMLHNYSDSRSFYWHHPFTATRFIHTIVGRWAYLILRSRYDKNFILKKVTIFKRLRAWTTLLLQRQQFSQKRWSKWRVATLGTESHLSPCVKSDTRWALVLQLEALQIIAMNLLSRKIGTSLGILQKRRMDEIRTTFTSARWLLPTLPKRWTEILHPLEERRRKSIIKIQFRINSNRMKYDILTICKEMATVLYKVFKRKSNQLFY